MGRIFFNILKKDFRLMLTSKFFLLTLGSLILYSCYINLVYVNLDQDIYPVYLYDPNQVQKETARQIISVDSREELENKISDSYGVGIDNSEKKPEIIMLSSGIESIDNYRSAYAGSLLSVPGGKHAEIIGTNTKEMKSRREITCEFLFFEITAVGFLGLAAILFKEKQMGVIRVHGILPINKTFFIFSKLILFLLADLLFSVLLTFINLGIIMGISVLPFIMLEAGILSILMALVGFLCALLLRDFKQFSLVYLVLAIFVSTPVFLAGQTNIDWPWIVWHPMYHMFMAIKNAYFANPSPGYIYYTTCALAIAVLFFLVHRMVSREMTKEG